jgi:CBS domain containing-hemolysin-like protein
MSRAGRVLQAGEEIEHESGVFCVEKVEGHRITRVRFLPAGTHALVFSLVMCL